MIDNKELAQYLYKRITEDGLVNCRSTWCQVPTEDELEFWVQQYKIKSGHTVWSEKFQRNIWFEND